MPTGTQSNLCALMAHCGRGDEYIVGQMAHTYRWEGGGAAVLGSIQPQPLAQQPDGTLRWPTSKPPSSPTTRTLRARGCWRWRTPGAARCCRCPTSKPPPRWRAQAAGHPPGRRTPVQRRGGFGHAGGRDRPPLRQRLGVLQQGPGRAGRLGPGGQRATDRPRPPRAQDAGRRHAPGRRAGRRRAACAGPPCRAPGRRPRPRAPRWPKACRAAGRGVQPPQTNIVFVDLAPDKGAGAVERLRDAGVLCTGLYRLRLVTHLDVDAAADIERASPCCAPTLTQERSDPCPSPTPKR
jgi:threonine aldolase